MSASLAKARAQHDRGIFETTIVSVVSRTEAFIQECVAQAIKSFPKKLTALSTKHITPDEFLAHDDRDTLLESLIASRCQDLMFAKPTDYLATVEKVLSIEIKEETKQAFIEMKASRDVIIHNQGEINKIYVEKAGKKKRGEVGEELSIDEEYFADVIKAAKQLAREIQIATQKKYG
jgi:hypothetical protein